MSGSKIMGKRISFYFYLGLDIVLNSGKHPFFRLESTFERLGRSISVCSTPLHYMWKETDDKVAVPMIGEALQRYLMINQCSFDKGHYSKDNVIELNKHLDNVILPKKG